MPTCAYCGKDLGTGEGHYSGGLLVCSTCGAGGSSSDDKPCQRCGILLPSHELQMWNSRLYCNYCIMDVKDEEALMKKHMKEAEGGGGHGGEGAGSENYWLCERCGRSVSHLYTHGGRRLCHICYGEETGGPPPESGSFFGKVKEVFHEAIGKRVGAGAGVEEKPKGETGGKGSGGGKGGGTLAPRAGFYDRKMPGDKKAADPTRTLLADRRKEHAADSGAPQPASSEKGALQSFEAAEGLMTTSGKHGGARASERAQESPKGAEAGAKEKKRKKPD